MSEREIEQQAMTRVLNIMYSAIREAHVCLDDNDTAGAHLILRECLEMLGAAMAEAGFVKGPRWSI